MTDKKPEKNLKNALPAVPLALMQEPSYRKDRVFFHRENTGRFCHNKQKKETSLPFHEAVRYRYQRVTGVIEDLDIVQAL